MLRYKNFATTTISVDLQNCYSVIAMANWNNNDKKYYVTLYIKRNDIDILDLLEYAENVAFQSGLKEIKADVTTFITTLYNDGFFDTYIRRYEYMMECFDAGNEVLSQKGNV